MGDSPSALHLHRVASLREVLVAEPGAVRTQVQSPAGEVPLLEQGHLRSEITVGQTNMFRMTQCFTRVFICSVCAASLVLVLDDSGLNHRSRYWTHPPTGPVEGTLEHRPQLAVDVEAFLMSSYKIKLSVNSSNRRTEDSETNGVDVKWTADCDL